MKDVSILTSPLCLVKGLFDLRRFVLVLPLLPHDPRHGSVHSVLRDSVFVAVHRRAELHDHVASTARKRASQCLPYRTLFSTDTQRSSSASCQAVPRISTSRFFCDISEKLFRGLTTSSLSRDHFSCCFTPHQKPTASTIYFPELQVSSLAVSPLRHEDLRSWARRQAAQQLVERETAPPQRSLPNLEKRAPLQVACRSVVVRALVGPTSHHLNDLFPNLRNWHSNNMLGAPSDKLLDHLWNGDVQGVPQ